MQIFDGESSGKRLSMGLSFPEIAQNLNIAASTAHRVYKLFEMSGNIDPKPSTGPRPDSRKLDDYIELFVIGFVLHQPAMYLKEVCKQVEDVSGIRVSESTICRLIKQHGITRKKIQQLAQQRSVQLRGEFMATVLLHKKEQFVWLDETGCDNRTYMRNLDMQFEAIHLDAIDSLAEVKEFQQLQPFQLTDSLL